MWTQGREACKWAIEYGMAAVGFCMGKGRFAALFCTWAREGGRKASVHGYVMVMGIA